MTQRPGSPAIPAHALAATRSILAPNIACMLWSAATLAPTKTAVIDAECRTDYASLRDRAAAIAMGLSAAGIAPGDRVGILLERSAEAAAAFFGVAATGAIAVVLNESLRIRQIEHVLRHSEATLLLTSAELRARWHRAPDVATRTLDVESIPNGADFPPHARVGEDVAQIIYTSGSTGMPKGVTVCHANLWAGMSSVSQYLCTTSDDRIASVLPFSFDYGFNQLLQAVGNVATLVIERSPMPATIVETLRREGVTMLAAVPPLWLQLLRVPDFAGAIPSLRALTNSGGRLPLEAVRALRRGQPQAALYLMYGLTEAFRATYLDPAQVDRRPDSIGRAIPGCEIHVLREDGTPCGVDEVGELVQRGPTVAAGYWNDPEATARVFRPNPLRPPGTPDRERVVHSGDLVRRDAEGLLVFVGRRDALIKSLGFRVSPDEVVEALHASGEVVEAAVTPEPDADRGEAIVAWVVLRPEGSAQRLARFCRAEMPRHLQPKRIETLERLPRLGSGKFDLAALRARGAAGSRGGAA